MLISEITQRLRRERRLSDGRLTKKLLFGLPEGTYIVSGIVRPDGSPTFEERIYGPAEHREALWLAARAAGATGRNCRVCQDVAAYICHLRELKIAFEQEQTATPPI
jgi:hypothetical protein